MAPTPATRNEEPAPLEALRRSISAYAFADESAAVSRLIEALKPADALEPAIHTHAEQLVTHLREKGTGSGVEAFLHEYGLGTREGIAIMCLAEALLRIPDAETADRLIRNTFTHTEWDKHLGESESLFVNASSWGLLLTGKVVNLGEAEDKPANVLRKLAGKFSEPVVRESLKAAMRFIGGQFVLGQDIEEALANSKGPARKGYRFSYDILGEGARSQAQVDAYMNAYRDAIGRVGKAGQGAALLDAPSISVKLSALHPRYLFAHQDRVIAELLPRIKEIALLAKQANITVSLDAEEATRLDIELILFEQLFNAPELQGWEGLGFVLQAYQKRAFEVIDFLSALARQGGKRMPLRLVKGAYWDSEIKWAQVGGLPGYPVFTRKEHTDISYLACADKILHHSDCFYAQFATHNARTIASIAQLAKHYKVTPKEFEFQRLHGMGEKLHDLVVGDYASRIYAPVGRHKDLLAYLIRRLLENGANTSFVHLLMDEEQPVSALVANPVTKVKAQGMKQNQSIPLPEHIYGAARRNSRGLDLGNLAMWEAAQSQRALHLTKSWHAVPLVAGAIKSAGPKRSVHAPSARGQEIGSVQLALKDDLECAVAAARAAFPGWNGQGVEARAKMLEDAAECIEAVGGEFMALLAREAGKNISDAVAEIREAADFCRYYAAEARRLMATPQALTGPTGESNHLSLHPRGVIACISPWNFPLAIFIGQVTAALAAGNTVVAKPAGQTPIVAFRAVQLLHEAGIPRDVVQLLPGSGAEIGGPLAAHPQIDGVIFTGSVETAQRINRSLAARSGTIVPLIAETGGQNCMVVDSSALLEQAVDDIILSAFGSAGQRCSALRVLFVQRDIADELIELLKGAMQELRLGDPLELSTDIGPVIDQGARDMLEAHIARMRETAKFIAAAPLPKELAQQGSFVAPHAFEIEDITQLEGEVFGPVLHIVRFDAEAREQVAEAINATGFGLTFGLHSRIHSNIEFFASRVHAGNCYINRSMIGATVGVQPFGGEGLSGTGPKAGGPHYLLRLLVERTRTVNTAAIGGNLALLSGEAS